MVNGDKTFERNSSDLKNSWKKKQHFKLKIQIERRVHQIGEDSSKNHRSDKKTQADCFYENLEMQFKVK